uniref:Uncharacterized protein n=1 Tax=Arundo donax TaxID=35708 RepID=A0A0A9MRG1_ARUDO
MPPSKVLMYSKGKVPFREIKGDIDCSIIQLVYVEIAAHIFALLRFCRGFVVSEF